MESSGLAHTLEEGGLPAVAEDYRWCLREIPCSCSWPLLSHIPPALPVSSGAPSALVSQPLLEL